MCHLKRGLFPLEEGRVGAEKWGARVEERGVCSARQYGSKRRSDGSWVSGLRGEVLKTNSGLNSGGTRRWRPHSQSWTVGTAGKENTLSQIGRERGSSHEVQTFGKTTRNEFISRAESVGMRGKRVFGVQSGGFLESTQVQTLGSVGLFALAVEVGFRRCSN